jgi:hypothetical protein
MPMRVASRPTMGQSDALNSAAKRAINTATDTLTSILRISAVATSKTVERLRTMKRAQHSTTRACTKFCRRLLLATDHQKTWAVGFRLRSDSRSLPELRYGRMSDFWKLRTRIT